MAQLAAAYTVFRLPAQLGHAAAIAAHQLGIPNVAGAHQQWRHLSMGPAVDVDADAVVIGAGVIGLAISRELALGGRNVILLEAAGAVGTETSSRNSEVIHAGLYYPPGSLKAQLCVQGKRLLYEFCSKHGVPHSRLGKLVVATHEGQVPALKALAAQGNANGVTDIRMLSGADVTELEPAVRCVAGLLSPSTGIIDSHSLMSELHRQFEEAGGTTALRSHVESGCVGGTVKRVSVRDAGSGEGMELRTRLVVNAAGLHAQAVAASLQGMPPQAIPPLFLAKGSYFTLTTGGINSLGSHAAIPKLGCTHRHAFRHLIYPMPLPGTAGLGTHLTLDFGGGVRFGPDVEWLPPGMNPRDIDYSVSAERAQPFYAAIRAYLPGLPDGALEPSYSGVRPKVVGPGRPSGDFLLQGPEDHGVAGLINCFGLESPGLTSCLAIARLITHKLCKFH